MNGLLLLIPIALSLGLLGLPPTLDSTARPALDTEFEFYHGDCYR